MNARCEAVTDLNLRGGVRDGVAKGLLRFADGDRHGNGKTALPGTAKRAVADDLGCQVHVGVRQDNDMVLRATLTLHALAAGGRTRVHMLGYGR